MNLGFNAIKVVGEERSLGLRTRLRPVNPFVSNRFEFDLKMVSYDLARALNSAKNNGSVCEAEAALIDAERRLYWNGYSGRATKVQVDDVRSATIAELRGEVFVDHYTSLRSDNLASSILSAKDLERELSALSRLGGSALNSTDLRNLRSSALGVLFRRLESTISAYSSGPKDTLETPGDEREYKMLVKLVSEYYSLVKTLEVTSPIDTQSIVISFCTKCANRSADAALNSALSMSEATWFGSRWFYAQAAEANLQATSRFVRRAGINLPENVYEACKLISAVRKDENYEIARAAQSRSDEIY